MNYFTCIQGAVLIMNLIIAIGVYRDARRVERWASNFLA
jgi:hypothetical protein